MTPGNPLAPVNRLKTFCYYVMCDLMLDRCHSENSWFCICVVRTALLPRIAGGIPGLTRSLVAYLKSWQLGACCGASRSSFSSRSSWKLASWMRPRSSLAWAPKVLLAARSAISARTCLGDKLVTRRTLHAYAAARCQSLTNTYLKSLNS